jgi:hypothetical protein
MTETGRPSLYDPEYCGDIVTHCATGASITSYAAEIGVCRDTITEWASKHAEFSVAVKRAKAAAAAWYDAKARGIIGGETGNATLCIFGLKNFAPEDFRDKQEIEHSGGLRVERVERVIVDPANPDR